MIAHAGDEDPTATVPVQVPSRSVACDSPVALALEVAHRMRKETVVVRESPGFITSRINAMIGNEAFYMLQEGVASAPDIDKALKLGLNHPMGPFGLGDESEHQHRRRASRTGQGVVAVARGNRRR